MNKDLTCALWQVGQVRATRRFSTCDLLVTLLWTPASGIRLAGGDDGDGGDDEEDYDDDIYIMMQCVFVCHEKSSLLPGSFL